MRLKIRGSKIQSKIRPRIYVAAMASFAFCAVSLLGQSSYEQSPSSADQRAAAMERRLNEVTAALNQTQQDLEKSMEEIKALRSQLNSLRGQLPAAAANTITSPSAHEAEGSSLATSTSTSAKTVEQLREEQDAIQSEIKLHQQTKVETASKYPLRVTGLVLFNAFSNAGVVDNIDLPGLALRRPPGVPHGSSGASLRQTLLGLEGNGPRLWGARSSADVSIDFFGGLTYNEYGYSTSVSEIVRLRQGKASLDWDKSKIEAGMTTPLISPLSPTSFATVSQPALASAGNLWTWSPQVRFTQKIPLPRQQSFGLEVGLLDPPSPGATSSSVQGSNAVEASRHPGVEGRISYRNGEDIVGSKQLLNLGLSIYSSDQLYGVTHVHSWAATADWQIPVYRWFTLSGEAYRGRALGGLGGGVYKDILTGTAFGSTAPQTNGVDAVGGWSQLKVRFKPTLEANVMFGLDDALASNFRRFTLPTSTPLLSLYSRNNMVVGNLIFRPKSYLIFSPEYRRIMTWSIYGPGNTANIFTLSAGYQF